MINGSRFFALIIVSLILAGFQTQQIRAENNGDDPNRYFICQMKSPSNKEATKNNGDCGPTCVAMAAKRWHKIPNGLSGSPKGVEDLISNIRKLATGKERHQHGTNGNQLAKAAESLGMKTYNLKNCKLETLNGELQKGRMVIGAGNPLAPGAYGRAHGGKKLYGGGHFILITGQKNGTYSVNDPAQKHGPITLHSRGLQAFLKGGFVISKD
jgi:hypothetical protein